MHFKEHSILCKQVAREIEDLQTTEYPLCCWEWGEHDDDEVEDFFETRVGQFGELELEEVQEYLTARAYLAHSYWDVAYEYEIKELWEKALFHYLEILRLDPSYDCEIHFRISFTLLYLNRDDDAFAFIRYWLKFENLRRDEIISRHAQAAEGDLFFPVERECRYLDIFKECPNRSPIGVDEPYLVALIIIKLRIVAAHDTLSRTLDFAFNETVANRIQEVRPIVQEMLGCCRDITHQRKQLDTLLDAIDHNVLHAMHDFEELAGFERFSALQEITRFHPYPINVTIMNGVRSFFRVPGSSDLLTDRTRR
jgi:tetratricopeptide (TPR) repeat protein